MSRPGLVLHGHFYQPPRENPWTDEAGRQPSAAPFRDWNERIAVEAYRPNAFARIVDDRGRVIDIVNNFAAMSFDIGPTLSAWLVERHPEVWRRVVDGDGQAKGAIAQTFFHTILPLDLERDVRTEIRWGLAEFAHRFGRPAAGLWLPETAVSEAVLAVVAEEGVASTILAPQQAHRTRVLAGGHWQEMGGGALDTRRPFRWEHPSGNGLGVDIFFYDGRLSHALAFEMAGLSSEELVDRAHGAAGGEGVAVLAADGETFGHHHPYGERLIAYALAVEAPRRGIDPLNLAEARRRFRPTHRVQVRESAWSCAHGVGRWARDCGCSTGGEPGWDQRWREPLRRALDLLRDAVDEAFERRGATVMSDPWAARDAYVAVVIGALDRERFVAEHVTGDPVTALALLEAQRQRLAMYTSCAWFFNDLAGIETVQVLRHAACAMDRMAEAGEAMPVEAFLHELEAAVSNVAAEGTGRDIWERNVVPARVDAERAVAHLAMAELLERRGPSTRVAGFDVSVAAHEHHDGGGLALCFGRVTLAHLRTGRRTDHAYAALHLGGLEVLGATRPPDEGRDRAGFDELRAAFASHAPVTTLLRLLGAHFGPKEFGLDAVLPDEAEEILAGAAAAVGERYAAAFDRLFSDHRRALVALASAGYPLPRLLRAPAELSLARRLETEVAAQRGSTDAARYSVAAAVAREARASGFAIDTPEARAAVERLVLDAARQAAADPDASAAAATLVEAVAGLGLHPSLEQAQEVVYEALRQGGGERLWPLARALGLAVESLGRPR
ncbi:MAG: DUF3536 domain-containing protein [Acidimicrobiales bacterium]